MLCLFCFAQYFIYAQTPTHNPIDPHWQLKWEDNFDTFNSNIWAKADTAARGNPQRPQLYLANQIWVSGGNLVIALNNTPITCPTPAPDTHWVCEQCTSGKTYNYRSGHMQSKSPYKPQYGYIEERIKFPYKEGKKWGFWPAFWTNVWSGQNTNAADFEIVEIFHRNNPPDHFQIGTARTYNPHDGDGPFFIYPSNFSYADWHTYAIEWNKDRVIWYLDGKAIASVNNHRIVDPTSLILNLDVIPENAYLPQTSPYFEEKMYVDYVKVYQLKCDKNTVVNDITNFNTYNYAVKKSITLSNATTIPAGSNITLRANDFIELKPGFEVQTGRELYLDVSPCETVNVGQTHNRN